MDLKCCPLTLGSLEKNAAPSETGPDRRPDHAPRWLYGPAAPGHRQRSRAQVTGQRGLAPKAVRRQAELPRQKCGHAAIAAVDDNGRQIGYRQAMFARQVDDALGHRLDCSPGQLDAFHAQLEDADRHAPLQAEDVGGAAVRAQVNGSNAEGARAGPRRYKSGYRTISKEGSRFACRSGHQVKV